MPVRAAIYARYSSDNQRDASIDDQIRICKERIAREGWQPVEVLRSWKVTELPLTLAISTPEFP